MSGAISIGIGGVAGWKILQRLEARQIEAVRRDAAVQRSTTHLRENIDKVRSPEALVGDYRLLSGVLSAFGLEADVANKAFIRKVLESNPADQGALVNRLGDKRYLRMAEALGMGQKDAPKDLADTLDKALVAREHERRVGLAHGDLRLAMNARRDLAQFAGRSSSERTLWYEAMSNPPLRKVLEGALGLNSAIGKLPVERQNAEFIRASERVFGTASLAELADPARMEQVLNRYLARAQIAENPISDRYKIALTLLRR